MSTSLVLLDWAGKATAMMLVAWFVTCCSRRPKLRRLIWVCAFSGSFLFPVLFTVAADAPVALALHASLPATGVSGADTFSWVLVIWLCGVGAALSWLVAGYIGLHRLLRSSQAFGVNLGELPGAGFRRICRLRLSHKLYSPLTFGCFRPVVLLPEAAKSWPADRLRAVLIHELGHVRNLDCGVILLAHLLSALLWFNPAVWLGLRALRNECETAADEAVVEAGLAPSTYAATLLSLASEMTHKRGHGMALSIVRTPAIEHRIRAIVDGRLRKPLKLHHGLAAVCGCALFIGTFASFRLAIAQHPPLGPASPDIFAGRSADWRRGYEMGRAFKTTFPNSPTTYKPKYTPEEMRELELRLSRERPPPD